MPAYQINVKKKDYKILQKEAQRKQCSTRELIREAFTRTIGSLRGGIGRRRRR